MDSLALGESWRVIHFRFSSTKVFLFPAADSFHEL